MGAPRSALVHHVTANLPEGTCEQDGSRDLMQVPLLTQNELIAKITTELGSAPKTESYSAYAAAPVPSLAPAYVLIVGAGFSYGVVPLVNELILQTIGDHYYPDQDQSSMKRPESVQRKDSAQFWKLFNRKAEKAGLPTLELDRAGLPKTPAAAYQYLFDYRVADLMIAPEDRPPTGFYEGLVSQRRRSQGLAPEVGKAQSRGAPFVKGFLRFVLDPGCEHGFGSTGRNELNPAHRYLAGLLDAQQSGRGWNTRPFCRTIVTTNFDTLLQNALQMVRLLYRITDRPERGFDKSDFDDQEGPIHLVYVHGSILRHNPASTTEELRALADRNSEELRVFLQSRDVIVLGYGGWNDALTSALRRCESSSHTVYWCDLTDEPSSHVGELLTVRKGRSAYVRLDKGGADGLMESLYNALIPEDRRRDLLDVYQRWSRL